MDGWLWRGLSGCHGLVGKFGWVTWVERKEQIVRSRNFNLKMRGEMQEEEFEGGKVRKMEEPCER